MVQRYDIEELSRNPYESYRCIGEDEDGAYVRYEDYAALDADFQDYITTTEMELKELREKLGLSS